MGAHRTYVHPTVSPLKNTGGQVDTMGMNRFPSRTKTRTFPLTEAGWRDAQGMARLLGGTISETRHVWVLRYEETASNLYAIAAMETI